MARVGVFGGTFDPCHVGHLVVANEALHALDLERLLFVPAADPPHKTDEAKSPADHRVAMLALALAPEKRFAVSRVDLDRPGPHYTVDMLTLLLAALGPATELYFVLGGDSLQDLPTWREPGGIVALATLAVVGRPGYEPDRVGLEREIPGLAHRLRFVDAPPVGVSSTDVRDRVASGRTIRYLVPATVEDYIHRHRLYAGPEPAVVGTERMARPDRDPRIVLATGNRGKQGELRALLAGLPLAPVTPGDLGLALDVPETGSTYAENACRKALAFAEAAGLPALADDSGLEVDALDGRPGPASARWVVGSDADRVAALLALLEGLPEERRAARFRAVAALARPDGRVVTADGRVEGRIATAPRGRSGFGYDPVFLVEDGGYGGHIAMAELPSAEKNVLSHRARAVAGLRTDLARL